ncbi:uncharacterized protein G2W53_034821 [Senna tora]|uniref:DUF3741 domain-containing protein n=1 Tax=Senna tora TaxID=362788 RepID=A0A834W849_9FABA|nr:uncharacterized protein G2W53_034821 [Senna tora]
MYRSFVTCDDPKGVVECGTLRKSRAGSQKTKDKTKGRKTAGNSETSLPNKSETDGMVIKGDTENSHDPSSLQLREVSRGVQRLNNMIDSWSRGVRYDVRSGDIAKDLLKGALDLQESLVMLSKLQEDSQRVSCLKKKQNEKPEGGRIDVNMMDGTCTNHFNEQNGSSRNCTEELKKVIKDSLVRQNLFPMTTTEGFDSASEIPSTSSSQSSGIHTDRLSDSSFSSATSKVRGPNLVARLMGLEEVPSRPLPTAVQKPLQGEKILNQKRPVFEIDMPKVRKTSSIIEKVDPERKKTLSEILEAVHFKGILKSSVIEPKLQIYHFNGSPSEHSDNLPPIVLMKPRCSLHRESVKPRAIVPPEDSSHRKLRAEAAPSKSVKHKGSTSMGNKIEDVSKRLTQVEKPKLLKEFVKLNEKEIMGIEKSSNKPLVQETIDKKAKVKTITRSLPEKEILKPRIEASSQDQREITPTKLRTPPSWSTRIKKNEIPFQQSEASITKSKTKMQKNDCPEIRTIAEQLEPEEEKSMAVPCEDDCPVIKTIAEQLGPEDEKDAIIPCKDDCTEIRTIAELAVEFPVEHEVDASANKIGDIAEDHKQSQHLSDVTLPKFEHASDATSAEVVFDNNNGCEAHSKDDKEGAELKYFLSTSQSFISHAEELLNLDVDCPMTLQKYETTGKTNFRLYLDCANELTERKSLQDSQIVHPLLLTCAGNSRLQISLGMLVEEIHNGIEKLKVYSTFSGEKLSVDNLYAMMKRDIKCNGVINGIWDLGWRHGFSADEAEQVVNEVGNLVLSGLIEELIVDL